MFHLNTGEKIGCLGINANSTELDMWVEFNLWVKHDKIGAK
jgi:hypothetical protein